MGARGFNDELDHELNHQNKNEYTKCEKKAGEDEDLFKVSESETIE